MTVPQKWLPLWSKDGGRIAFLRAVSQEQALANLIVLDPNGDKTAEIVIRPADNAPPAGMRFVEDVEWLSSERIAVSGSINPSTAENLVFDLPSSREVRDFYDDGSRAVYSPDGAHVAYQVGSPHFTPAEEREPALEVDGKRVFPERGVQLSFIAEPRWSPNSRKLAVVTDTMGAQQKSLAIWEAEDGRVRTFAPRACQGCSAGGVLDRGRPVRQGWGTGLVAAVGRQRVAPNCYGQSRRSAKAG
jgi:hypothetical protein